MLPKFLEKNLRKRLNFPVMVVTGTVLTLSGATVAATSTVGTFLGGVAMPLVAMVGVGYGINAALDALQRKLECITEPHWIIKQAMYFHRARRVITGTLVGAALVPFFGVGVATIWGFTTITIQRLLMTYHNQLWVKYNRWNLLLNSLAIISAIAAPYLGLANLAGRAAAALMLSGSTLATQYRGFVILKNINLFALTAGSAALSLIHNLWNALMIAIAIMRQKLAERLFPWHSDYPVSRSAVPNFIQRALVRIAIWMGVLPIEKNQASVQTHTLWQRMWYRIGCWFKKGSVVGQTTGGNDLSHASPPIRYGAAISPTETNNEKNNRELALGMGLSI